VAGREVCWAKTRVDYTTKRVCEAGVMMWVMMGAALRFLHAFSVDNRISLEKNGLWVGYGTFVFCFSTAILDSCKSQVSVISITDKRK